MPHGPELVAPAVLWPAPPTNTTAVGGTSNVFG